jgi:hypothetical protein
MGNYFDAAHLTPSRTSLEFACRQRLSKLCDQPKAPQAVFGRLPGGQIVVTTLMTTFALVRTVGRFTGKRVAETSLLTCLL